MEPGYINIAEIEFICDAGPLTMVVMKTSYFDQQRVERKRRRRRRQKKRSLLKGQGCGAGVCCALGSGSRPFPEDATGRGASCTLTCLDGARSLGFCFFCPVSKGEGCSLTPTTSSGGSWGVGSGRILSTTGREGDGQRHGPAVRK